MKGTGDHGQFHICGASIQGQLVQFTRVLRGLGVRVGTSELLDAVRSLGFVDITQKEQFKTALGCLLVKSQAERKLFELAFEDFFVPPEIRQSRHLQEQDKREKKAQTEEHVTRELTEIVQESGGRWAGRAQNHLELTPEQKEAYASMPEADRKRMRHIIESFEGNPVNDPSGLIASVVEASLNYWRYHMMQKEAADRPNRGRGLNVEYTGEEELDEVLRSVAQKYDSGSEESLLYRDMQVIAEHELPRVTALVTRLSRKLANRISRRYRRSNAHRAIDMRRTVRNNLVYGGVPLRLAYRNRWVNRPRLVVICDVSASMVRYARFIIQFVYGLAHVVRDIETFIFSEDLERITQYFDGSGFADNMAAVMARSGQWGKTTNINAALKTLQQDYGRVLTPGTYVLLVSDTKTQHSASAAARVNELKKKVKEIIWLNTLPAAEWEKNSTVSLFKEHVRMFECGTVAQLDRVLRIHLL